MFARIAVLVFALAGAHAGIVGGYRTVAAPAIAAPAYGLGLGYGSVLASPISRTIVSAPTYGAAIAGPAYGLGLGYGAALSAPITRIAAAPVVSSYGNIW